MAFPQTRMRRLRATRQLRGLVRETQVSAEDLIYPMFVAHGVDRREPIEAMPGIDRLSIAHAVEEAREAVGLGVPAVLLFGLPATKDEQGSGAWDDEGIVQLATRAIKEALPELIVVSDLCLCEYTSHGHCGALRPDGSVDNDATLELLSRTATSQARAGADVIAPSDMMDGRVGVIRTALDDEGFSEKPILAYSAKFASAFYGPFRDAADSAPAFGDRRGYQLDPANGSEALREARLDVEEGADILMVKPALPYLDLIRRIKDETSMPLAAYNVSGEYSMLKAAAAAGYMDEQQAVLETLTSIRRAGADIVITYHAKVDPENPWRAANIINEHPGVSHNYLRNHEFNIWFTIATEPDSPLGLDGTLEVLAKIAGAESIRQLPTLKLFKIRMDLEMEGSTQDLAQAVEAAPPAETERQPYDELDIAVIRATQGDMPVVEEPYALAAQALGISQEQLLEHLSGMQERRLLRRVAAI